MDTPPVVSQKAVSVNMLISDQQTAQYDTAIVHCTPGAHRRWVHQVIWYPAKIAKHE